MVGSTYDAGDFAGGSRMSLRPAPRRKWDRGNRAGMESRAEPAEAILIASETSRLSPWLQYRVAWRKNIMAGSAMAGIPALKETYQLLKTRMDKAVEDFRTNLASIRTGRASVHMLDQVKVLAYGTEMPLNQV